VVVRHGPALRVPADANDEELEARRRELEQVLIALTGEADRDVQA
jgi:hypothetical protein